MNETNDPNRTGAHEPDPNATFDQAPEPPPEPAGVAIPGFAIECVLGRGGMGVVYKATQTGLNRVVALKMLIAGQYASPASRARFLLEAESVAALEHLNIVRVFAFGESGGHPYLAMEYVPGGTLADRVKATGPLPAKEATELVATLAAAVAHAHSRGVVHRDIKPLNVLLTADGEPRLTDFGLAKVGRLDQNLSVTGQVLGTPAYMAPEQAAGKVREVGAAVDVYALGAVLYDLLTGRPPFQGDSAAVTLQKVLTEEPTQLRRLNTSIPRDVETICLKCLEKDPVRRYPTAQALADDLRRFLNGEPIQARPVRHPERIAKWVRRRPERAALIALGVLLIAGGAGLALWPRQPELVPQVGTPGDGRSGDVGINSQPESVRSVAVPPPEPQPTDVERLFNAMHKPLVKIECQLREDAPTKINRAFIPNSLLQPPGPNDGSRLHSGPLYFLISGIGKGHSLDLSDQPGQGSQITQFGGEITVTGPHLLFVGGMLPGNRVFIKGGIGYSMLAPMNSGTGSKHIEFDGTHLLMPKLEPPKIDTATVTDAERATLRNPDLVQKTVLRYGNLEYIIFCRPGTKIIPSDVEERKKQFPAIHELIELDRKRQLNALTYSNEKLQEALEKK